MWLSKPIQKPYGSETVERWKASVKCGFCRHWFRNPKVFPCLHSFCYECIVELAKRECGLECPECQTPVEVRFIE